MVLSVGWELSQGFELQGLVTPCGPLHRLLELPCSMVAGFLSECSIKEPGSVVFCDLASEVILYHFSHNLKIEGGEV